ncbi:MAG: hypothetical protein QOJ98_1479 [Acidobacteriota bacterium]|jgi:hypothetical protein|nr:hypothetical protein [Acidobacteriota bacterium]
MPYKKLLAALALAVVCPLVSAQEAVSQWSWGHRLELRGNYRWSQDEQHPTNFPPGGPGLETVDPGHHVELNVADIQFDLGYGEVFAARAKVHGQALHRRNPTSEDRQIDADELWVRIGRKPEFLERPDGTTFFLQAGKFPKMERQPVRLLESYGLAATAFNRFEDLQLLAGGTVGRNFYWRAQVANGNPLFIRDPNALAGDNGTEARLNRRPPEYGSGFPILYNAESEDLLFKTDNLQLGEALGYRWQRADETLGFDAIVFHYRRDLADTVELYGTGYGGDLDILSVGELSPVVTLPISGRKKEEYGARVYAEWHQATLIAQVTAQDVAGLKREGWELEAGYQLPFKLGPIQSIQPALRVSGLETHYHGTIFPAPSVWWEWTKFDAGVRIGLPRGFDVTAEYTVHDIAAPRRPVAQRETLVTVRWRV